MRRPEFLNRENNGHNLSSTSTTKSPRHHIKNTKTPKPIYWKHKRGGYAALNLSKEEKRIYFEFYANDKIFIVNY